MENLKRTPIYEEHLQLNAKMVPFAGWEMPVQYTGIIDEHLVVRNKVGLFDVSHMGEFFIWGKDALDLLQKLVPRDISKLSPGKAVYSQLVTKTAGIIDDLIIYRLDDKNNYSHFLLIVNASRINEDLNWIECKKDSGKYNLEIENRSKDLALLAIQGPLAVNLLEDLGISKTEQPEKFSISKTEILSCPVFISRTGYTGEDGFEIIVENNNAVKLWRAILSEGKKYGIKPIGLGARDTLRLEASLPLYGQDLDEETTPVEAGLGWSISKGKLENYLGKELTMSQLNSKDKLTKTLVGFRMMDRSIPRHNYELYKDDKKIGFVTSGGVAPYIGANIGLGYLNESSLASLGTQIQVKIRDKFHPAEIINRPFYTRSDIHK